MAIAPLTTGPHTVRADRLAFTTPVREASAAGHWITLHAAESDEGTVHVYVGGGGYIEKGPASLVHQHIGQLASHPSVTRTTRHAAGHEPEGARSHPQFIEGGPKPRRGPVAASAEGGEAAPAKAPGKPYARLSGTEQGRRTQEVGKAIQEAQSRAAARAARDRRDPPRSPEHAAERTASDERDRAEAAHFYAAGTFDRSGNPRGGTKATRDAIRSKRGEHEAASHKLADTAVAHQQAQAELAAHRAAHDRNPNPWAPHLSPPVGDAKDRELAEKATRAQLAHQAAQAQQQGAQQQQQQEGQRAHEKEMVRLKAAAPRPGGPLQEKSQPTMAVGQAAASSREEARAALPEQYRKAGDPVGEEWLETLHELQTTGKRGGQTYSGFAGKGQDRLPQLGEKHRWLVNQLAKSGHRATLQWHPGAGTVHFTQVKRATAGQPGGVRVLNEQGNEIHRRLSEPEAQPKAQPEAQSKSPFSAPQLQAKETPQTAPQPEQAAGASKPAPTHEQRLDQAYHEGARQYDATHSGDAHSPLGRKLESIAGMLRAGGAKVSGEDISRDYYHPHVVDASGPAEARSAIAAHARGAIDAEVKRNAERPQYGRGGLSSIYEDKDKAKGPLDPAAHARAIFEENYRSSFPGKRLNAKHAKETWERFSEKAHGLAHQEAARRHGEAISHLERVADNAQDRAEEHRSTAQRVDELASHIKAADPNSPHLEHARKTATELRERARTAREPYDRAIAELRTARAEHKRKADEYMAADERKKQGKVRESATPAPRFSAPAARPG